MKTSRLLSSMRNPNVGKSFSDEEKHFKYCTLPWITKLDKAFGKGLSHHKASTISGLESMMNWSCLRPT
jgi:hypothetical protein